MRPTCSTRSARATARSRRGAAAMRRAVTTWRSSCARRVRPRVRFAPAGLVTACPVAAALVAVGARRGPARRPAPLRRARRPRRPFRQLCVPPPLRPQRGRLQRACHRQCGRHRRLPPRQRAPHQRASRLVRARARTPPSCATVRDGACDLFATVLSPDYNAAHADHLHFDQAMRGAMGWRGCR